MCYIFWLEFTRQTTMKKKSKITQQNPLKGYITETLSPQLGLFKIHSEHSHLTSLQLFRLDLISQTA